jgi:RNA polymerase sigma-70 factor (ECF subfamily)
MNTWSEPRFHGHNGTVPVDDGPDGDLVAALRAGDEVAFRAMVSHHHGAMVRVASYYVGSRAVAEEVAQETWLAVIKGLDGFEGRSSLRTWIFRILSNQARRRGTRETRSIPFSTLTGGNAEPAVDPSHFRRSDDPWPGHWETAPQSWSDIPAERLVEAETRALVDQAIGALPEGQREVITLRDLEGWTADETCELLAINAVNQRVLLHRARSRVRAALDAYVDQVVRA